jgi:hypothetical protein
MPLRLDLHLRPSRRLAVWLLFVHGGAAIVVWRFPTHFAVTMAASFAILANGIEAFRRHVLMRGTGAVSRLEWTPDGRWIATAHDGRRRESRLLPGSFVHPGLTVLRLSWPGSVIVFPDSLDDPDAFRRLRVRLLRERGS